MVQKKFGSFWQRNAQTQLKLWIKLKMYAMITNFIITQFILLGRKMDPIHFVWGVFLLILLVGLIPFFKCTLLETYNCFIVIKSIQNCRLVTFSILFSRRRRRHRRLRCWFLLNCMNNIIYSSLRLVQFGTGIYRGFVFFFRKRTGK